MSCLDVPFNSKRDYSMLFKSPKRVTSEQQINEKQRAEHLDYEPGVDFKKAKAESDPEQQTLISLGKSLSGAPRRGSAR
jgi:hypothetical protein